MVGSAEFPSRVHRPGRDRRDPAAEHQLICHALRRISFGWILRREESRCRETHFGGFLLCSLLWFCAVRSRSGQAFLFSSLAVQFEESRQNLVVDLVRPAIPILCAVDMAVVILSALAVELWNELAIWLDVGPPVCI